MNEQFYVPAALPVGKEPAVPGRKLTPCRCESEQMLLLPSGGQTRILWATANRCIRFPDSYKGKGGLRGYRVVLYLYQLTQFLIK